LKKCGREDGETYQPNLPAYIDKKKSIKSKSTRGRSEDQGIFPRKLGVPYKGKERTRRRKGILPAHHDEQRWRLHGSTGRVISPMIEKGAENISNKNKKAIQAILER